MKESPVFAKLKTEGKTSKNPLKESFGKKEYFCRPYKEMILDAPI
jgi:hypothetical protein